MGPKKGAEPLNKKQVVKKQDKIIEDKTFGLKNKNKSKTVQNYIKTVETTVKGGKNNDEFLNKAEKQRQKEEEAFLASLSKAVVKNVKQAECDDLDERKNVLCEFFKQGFCEDGDKCKFSHDLNIEFNVSLLFL